FSGTADFFNATRFVTANNGGTAILDVGSPAIGNFFKNTQLAVADGEGSSVVWNSVNDFYFQPGATMQGGGVTQKIIDSMKYAGTITDWAGKVHHINSLDDLKQYNQYLIKSLEDKTLSYKQYDAEFNKALIV
ncbi:hypothetical protein, partial [Escherichia coli]